MDEVLFWSLIAAVCLGLLAWGVQDNLSVILWWWRRLK